MIFRLFSCLWSLPSPSHHPSELKTVEESSLSMSTNKLVLSILAKAFYISSYAYWMNYGSFKLFFVFCTTNDLLNLISFTEFFFLFNFRAILFSDFFFFSKALLSARVRLALHSESNQLMKLMFIQQKGIINLSRMSI